LFFDEPVVAGQGNNSKQVIRRVFGVVVACGLAASCSSSSDFGSAMGFTQLAEQGLGDPSKGETTSAITTASVDDASQVPSSDAASPEVLAFAHPTPRPAALAAEEIEAVADVAVPVQQPAAVAAIAEQGTQPQATDAVAGKQPEGANQAPEAVETAALTEPVPAKKRGFFSSLFGSRSEQPENEVSQKPAAPATPQVAAVNKPETRQLAEKKVLIDTTAVTSAYSASVLPGVRENRELFDIVRKSNGSDDSDVDLYEEEGTYQLASAVGLARLAPHGLLKQREDVDTSCFKPHLVRLLKIIEGHYGKPVVVTSGYRSPAHNRRVRGARKSAHMDCAAADIQVAGVSRWELAKFARSLPGRGGVGTYCHTASVHVDVGSERDWNWRCRK